MMDLDEQLNWVETCLEEFRDSFLGTSLKVCLETTDIQPRNRVGEDRPWVSTTPSNRLELGQENKGEMPLTPPFWSRKKEQQCSCL